MRSFLYLSIQQLCSFFLYPLNMIQYPESQTSRKDYAELQNKRNYDVEKKHWSHLSVTKSGQNNKSGVHSSNEVEQNLEYADFHVHYRDSRG